MSAQIPAIPGQLVPHHLCQGLRQVVGELSGTFRATFPGSQPVSFTKSTSLPELLRTNYLVCEKSDGVRVLVLMLVTDNRPQTYFITRKNEYYLAPFCAFPTHTTNLQMPTQFHHRTLIDAELVIDIHPGGKVERKLLGFDALSVNGTNCMSLIFEKRLGQLRDYVFDPFRRMSRFMAPAQRQHLPFAVEMKVFERSYGAAKVQFETIPRLLHKSDGLIFTSVEAPYTPGTCASIIKWKPASENSVDFKLHVIDPISLDVRLLVWMGGTEYTEYGRLALSPEDLGRGAMAGIRSASELEGRIAETLFDAENNGGRWRFLRFRDDKPHGNHLTTVEKIRESMDDNLELPELLESMVAVRTAWKEREAKRMPQVPN
ncbi:Dcp1p-Dcp2p decapping enzyme complex alpha subunit [Coemansia sp. BCRC 34301]|nr:Dcp1p-Dcp2p decapping enzyme complex alpha subunit [Coemansia sp. BCRC 34301]